MAVEIAVLGAGRWGSAFAIYLQRLNFKVTIYSHNAESCEYIIKNGFSKRLPQYSFNKDIIVSSDINEAVKNKEIIIFAIPTTYLVAALKKIKTIANNSLLISITKGIEQNNLLLVPELVKKFFPENEVMHLGGPCFPSGLLDKNSYSAEVIASKNLALATKIQNMFSSKNFRIYVNQDIYGVAMMGAIKNVFAIAAGVLDGYNINLESKTILISRGLNEMLKIGAKLGITANTIYGLSGLGDLVLTCYGGNLSHNYSFGKLIVAKEDVKIALKDFEPAVPEGYYTAQALFNLVEKHAIDAPISKAVYNFLYKNHSFSEIVSELMARPLTSE